MDQIVATNGIRTEYLIPYFVNWGRGAGQLLLLPPLLFALASTVTVVRVEYVRNTK